MFFLTFAYIKSICSSDGVGKKNSASFLFQVEHQYQGCIQTFTKNGVLKRFLKKMFVRKGQSVLVTSQAYMWANLPEAVEKFYLRKKRHILLHLHI